MTSKRIIINTLVLALLVLTVYSSRDELGIFYNKTKGFISDIQKSDISKAIRLPELRLSKQHEQDRETITPGPLIRENDDSEDQTNPLSVAGIVAETNIRRKAAGLPELTLNTRLSLSATRKVNDMLLRQYFEHESPTGESIDDLAKAAGYEYILVGENLAYGNFSDDNDVVTAWMDSPGHRANMLNPRYTEIGVGVVEGLYEGRNVSMAVQHFGVPVSSCPSVDEKLKVFIGTEEMRLDAELELLQEKREKVESMESTNPTYQSEIEGYNAQVVAYNAAAKNLRSKIDEYNASVRKFNECIEG